MDKTNQKTILIVEDEAPLRKVLTDVLEEANFSILEAKDGKVGVEQALAKHPDLILLDLLMPVMDGMEALKIIRKDAWGANVPVIILTNLSATKEEVVKDMVAGRPEYYLIKSDWKLTDLVEKIKKLLEK